MVLYSVVLNTIAVIPLSGYYDLIMKVTGDNAIYRLIFLSFVSHGVDLCFLKFIYTIKVYDCLSF